ASGVAAERIIVLEKSEEHSWVIRRFYPASKRVTANYKGIEARCHGVLCIPDLSRDETLSYLDRAIRESGVTVRYREEVSRISREPGGRLRVESSGVVVRARVVVIAIGVLGRPNRPSWPIPVPIRSRVLFDVTSEGIRNLDVLVVGGGDAAAEYSQFLVEQPNRVTLSYRGRELSRPNQVNRQSVLELEREGKLRILWGSNIQSVEPSGEKVRVRFESQSPPAVGGAEFDRIVCALGGTNPENFLMAAGIEFDGPAPRLTSGFGTSVPGLYLAGDLTAGRKGGSIILAFNTAHAAMLWICGEHGICRL
ncbi:MAG: NAD(P)-binding domain-containing protein, partial [Vicinamibacteria bacterium]